MTEDSLIAVTGATGFVGRAVVKDLVKAGCQVRPIVRNLSNAQGIESPIAVGNIDSTTQWSAALKGVHCVIHCAARVHVMQDASLDPLAEFRAVNTAGTRSLAEQAAKLGVKRLVFVSSVKVMGEKTQPGHPFLTTDIPAPQDPYGQSKWEAEQALKAVAQNTGLEVVVVRPPLVYGPGVGGNFEQLIRLVKSGLPLPLGAIDNRRSMIALDNLVQLLSLCATHPLAPGHIFFASDGEAPSTPQLVQAIAAAQHGKAHLWSIPTPVLRLAGRLTGRLTQIERLTDSLQVDDQDTRRILKWQPVANFHEGIRRTVSNEAP